MPLACSSLSSRGGGSVASVGDASTCLTLLLALLMSSVADCSALCKLLPLFLAAAGASGSAELHTMHWGRCEHLGKRPRTREGLGIGSRLQGRCVGPAVTLIQLRRPDSA